MAGPLLDDRLAPLGRVLGLIEAPLDACLEPFIRLVARGLPADEVDIARQPARGPLDRALAALLPATDRPAGDRFLLAATSGRWTAFFENGAGGGDPRTYAGFLPEELGCRTATVYAVPAGPGETDGPGGFAVLGYTLAAPGRAGRLDAVRVLVVHRVDGEREVQSFGDPLPGEGDPAGFDLDRLDGVLRSLGIRAFDPDWYLPAGTEGVLLRLPD